MSTHTKTKRGRPRLPESKRTVHIGGRITPEAFYLLRMGHESSGKSLGKYLSQIIVQHAGIKLQH